MNFIVKRERLSGTFEFFHKTFSDSFNDDSNSDTFHQSEEK